MNFLTPEQVAEMLKVTPDVVLQWLRQGKLPGVRIGNVWRIEEGRLEAFLFSKLDSIKSDVFYDECSFAVEEYDLVQRPLKKDNRGRKPSGKYDGLKRYLKQAKGDQIKLSFAEIEAYMHDKLPQSAYRLRPWWGNDFSHSQARSWLHAGWETRGVDLEKRLITFIRRS